MIDRIKAFLQPFSSADFRKRYHQYEGEIFFLSLAQAKTRADVLLADPEKFTCTVKEVPSDQINNKLASSLTEFFARYESVQWLEGSAYLDRATIEEFKWNNDFLQLGEDSDSTFILTKPLQDPIYVIYGDAEDEQVLEDGRYPSIYHWILMKDLDKYSGD